MVARWYSASTRRHGDDRFSIAWQRGRKVERIESRTKLDTVGGANWIRQNINAYHAMAQKAADLFKEYGATRVVEAWGDDVPDGKVTDFKRAVKATNDEKVVYSWVEWPSKKARDTAWPKIMADERMKPDKTNMPFDGQRMIYGGFAPILDA